MDLLYLEIIVKNKTTTKYIPVCPYCFTEMEPYSHPRTKKKHCKCPSCGTVIDRMDKYQRNQQANDFSELIRKKNESQQSQAHEEN